MPARVQGLLRERKGCCESARGTPRAQGLLREPEIVTDAGNLSVIRILREREKQKVGPYEGE